MAISAYRFDYLDFPVLLQVVFFGESNITPLIVLGPYYSAKLKAKVEMEEGDVDRTHRTVDSDSGFIMGGGFIVREHFILMLRYSQSMTTITNDRDGQLRHRLFQFLISWRI